MTVAVVALIVLAVALCVCGVWLWWQNRKLAQELAANQKARFESMQDEADAKTEAARAEAELKQHEAIERLNREVVHVDPDSDLAGAFDRATGRDEDS